MSASDNSNAERVMRVFSILNELYFSPRDNEQEITESPTWVKFINEHGEDGVELITMLCAALAAMAGSIKSLAWTAQVDPYEWILEQSAETLLWVSSNEQ